MRKMLACGAVLAILLALPGCGKAKDSPVSLYEEGMDVVSLMAEMVQSEEYGAVMNSSAEIQTVAETLAAGDYTEPEAVYEVSAPTVQKILELYGGEGDLAGLSEPLMDYLGQRLPTTAISQLNAQAGVVTLAATSVYTAAKTFAGCELAEPVIYVYGFAAGTPVAVVFVPGEGGAVSASGMFLMGGGLADAAPEELLSELEEAFQLYDCTVKLLDVTEK